VPAHTGETSAWDKPESRVVDGASLCVAHTERTQPRVAPAPHSGLAQAARLAGRTR
jgi:hypothetical protein